MSLNVRYRALFPRTPQRAAKIAQAYLTPPAEESRSHQSNMAHSFRLHCSHSLNSLYPPARDDYLTTPDPTCRPQAQELPQRLRRCRQSLPLLSCLSPCAFPALYSLLFCSLCFYVPICAAIPVFPVLLPAFPVRPFLSIPRRFCKSRTSDFPTSRIPAMPLSGVDRLFCDRINRSSDALFLPCA